jgi:hypothetical protein
MLLVFAVLFVIGFVVDRDHIPPPPPLRGVRVLCGEVQEGRVRSC